jgi:hypothetical protein
MNARDLSEPPNNGTTSGCPPPSQHHNYRRALHTQQRNRSERWVSGRFWKGVAQITRNRDWTFIASLWFISLFQNSSICHADRCAGSGCAESPLLAPRASTESSDEAAVPAAKMAPEYGRRTALPLRSRCSCFEVVDAHSRLKDARGFVGWRGNWRPYGQRRDRITPYFSGKRCYFRYASGIPDAGVLC